LERAWANEQAHGSERDQECERARELVWEERKQAHEK
jgi:hypothetical protein